VKYAREIVPELPVYKIPNGVEDSFLESYPGVKANDYDKHSLVYVADFIKWYNLPKLLQAIAILKKEYSNIKLLLVGEGRAIPEAKIITKELGLTEHVQFFGQVEQDEVIRIVQKCEVGIQTLVKDLRSDSAFPLKILEYTALGRKVVASNLEEVKRLDFPNVIVYEENQGMEVLINAIKQAFNMDIDLLKTKNAIVRYSWKNIASEFRCVLQEAINN
jgi:glycosyltransferase involved in cell wall biosynthesis